MKKNLLFPGMLFLMGALSLSSCGEDPAGGSSRKGSIAPSVGIDAGFLGLDIISKAGGDLTTDDLSLTVTSSDGSFTQTWDSYGDFNPEEEQFPIGDYTVEVAYGDRMAEGFDNRVVAAYYDSQDIQILEGAATPVELTASRTHAIVSIKYTEAFEHYIKSGAVDIISSTGNGITYVYNDDKPETRSSLIVPGRTRVLVDIEKYNGTWIHNVEAANFETKARGSYTVTLDVNESSLGSAILNVVIDDNVTTEEIPVDISDDVVEAPAPEIILEGVAENEELTVVEGTYAGDPVKVMFIAKGELAAINFTAQSYFLDRRAGWEAATDQNGVELISLEQGQQGKYKQYGLECHGVWNQPGRLAVIDMTNVINSIEYNKNDLDYKNVSTFTFTARDKYGKEAEQPVSFSVKILPIELALLNPSTLRFYDTELDIDLSFNGGSDPTDIVKIEYKNNRGTYDPVTIGGITNTSRDLYRVHITDLPSDESDLTLRAEINGRRSPECIVSRHGVVASVVDNNIYAKRAYVTLQPKDLTDADITVSGFSLISDGNRTLEFEKIANNIYLIKGLIPAAINNIAVNFDNSIAVCAPLNIYTESASQLPNHGMEDWSVSASGKYWKRYEPFKAGETQYWDTMNGTTTSSRNGTDETTYTYVANSGTVSSTDTHSQSGLAALIRTVGWGAGNTASANAFDRTSFGNCKNITAGELYLGKWVSVDSVKYGYSFGSRPLQLSFWYKYSTVTANNGDYATAEIQVLDASGRVIVSQNTRLEAVGAYTNCRLDLNYNLDCEKAKSIRVRFKSSGNSACLKAEKKYMTPPPPLNLSTGEYLGSQLYIDDIELIY